MAESRFLTQLNLSQAERLNPPKTIGRLKTIQEWASAAIESVKDNNDFLTAIKDLSPWAEAVFSAAKDSIGPLKFIVKLFDELTKIQDPEELARLAVTLAYQSAAEQAIAGAGSPTNPSVVGPPLDEGVDDVDFANFTVDQAVTHAFVAKADLVLQHYLPQAGYSLGQVDQIIAQIHDSLPSELNSLISHGKSKEKFDPLFRWLALPADGRLSRAALRRHAEYVSWVFNKAPVLHCEAYALADILIEAECSKLTHGDFQSQPGSNRPCPNPFKEGDENGGRHPLLETVMEYIADPKFREAIVIQGSAGSGKSTFTLRLADYLRREGLRPIRIRLRDVILGKEFYSQLGEALSYQDEYYLEANERFVSAVDPLRGGAIFQEEVHYGDRRAVLCPYVLILDGWDEISVAVSEGFKQRVKDLLLRIRSELFRSGRPTVRVILTGRPSDAIDECTEFFRDETPVLTIRTLHPRQLPQYADKLRIATQQRPLSYDGVSYWTFPDQRSVKPIFDRYSEEFDEAQKGQPSALPGRKAQTGVAAVLGYPLLLHFTFRLLAETDADRKELIESPTALLRRLTDYATEGANLPSDRQQGAKIQGRLSGSDLRLLLRRTAAHMTAQGQESISKAELEKRLRATDLVGRVKDVTKDKAISALLVSFYFKGGNTALGCEFTHKAFREYLFAEEIVETLKTWARAVHDDLPERPPSRYWKDFDEADPRRKAATELAGLLAPQWLSPEVVSHLASLLDWEIARTFSSSTSSHGDGGTVPATAQEWRRVRTLLADLWDWWADGVHLRPQPRDDEDTGQVKWDSSLAERLVPKCRPLIALPSGDLPEPVRTTTLDAHLGDALFRLSSWVHRHLQVQHRDEAACPPRRSQRLYEGRLRFRPSGTNWAYFVSLCGRISAAGWRPDGLFPMGVDAKGIDLGDTALAYLTFERVDLEDAYFDGAQIVRCNLEEANLAGCKFWGALLVRSDLSGARLDGADFGGAYLFSNQFNGATLTGASFSGAPLLTSTSGFGRHIALPGNDFSDVEGITLAEIEMASKRPERRQSRTNIAQLRSASRTLNETPISSPAQGGLRAVR
jgi:uncharacterized protein YjbI with pentapeptide repeats